MSLTIYGSSDDLVEIEGDHRIEVNVVDRPCIIAIREKDAAMAGVDIVMEYRDNGTWAATVVRLDEDALIPWDITVSHHAQVAYSVRVDVDCTPGRYHLAIDGEVQS